MNKKAPERSGALHHLKDDIRPAARDGGCIQTRRGEGPPSAPGG